MRASKGGTFPWHCGLLDNNAFQALVRVGEVFLQGDGVIFKLSVKLDSQVLDNFKPAVVPCFSWRFTEQRR